jgi:predicted ATP-grasp superfamily ATP-dependent carboligase
MMSTNRVSDSLPPVVILGGTSNALSVARSLGRLGVQAYALNRPGAYVFHSRYCKEIRTDKPWDEFLLGPDSDFLRGAVVLACADNGIDIPLDHRDALLEKYRLDITNVEAQRAMLDKLATVRAAEKAGVLAPRHWLADDRAALDRIEDELVYPLLVKPLRTDQYAAKTGRKFEIVNDFDQLRAILDSIELQFLLQEKIPMPDDRLCSYYTYIDENGEPLFHYNKRIIRRYPKNRGMGCYHVSDVIPEVRDLSLKFLRSVGLRGIANIEFVHDDRDGKLKLIECNARFAAPDALLRATGVDLARLVYERAIGKEPTPTGVTFRKRYYWCPWEDLHAMVQLRELGEITVWQWLKGLPWRPVLPYMSITDPWPSIRAEFLGAFRRLGKLIPGRRHA